MHCGDQIWPKKRAAAGLFMVVACWWLAAVLCVEADVQEGASGAGQGRDLRDKCRARLGRERRMRRRRRRRLWAHGKLEGDAQGQGEKYAIATAAQGARKIGGRRAGAWVPGGWARLYDAGCVCRLLAPVVLQGRAQMQEGVAMVLGRDSLLAAQGRHEQ
jgi:hypothetical protein